MGEAARVLGLSPPRVVALDARGERLPTRTGDVAGDVPPGALVALSVSDPAQLSAAYFALLEVGAVPLLLNPALPRETAHTLATSARAWAWLHMPAAGERELVRFAAAPLLEPRPAHVSCTSGTTGHGAVPTMHLFAAESALANARAHLASLALTGESAVQRMLLPLPLSHSFGLVCGAYAAAALGATLFAFESTPDPSTLLTVLVREQIELVYLTPPLLRLLLKRARGRALGDFPALRVVSVGSAPVTRGELRAMLRGFPGARGYFTYGLTELGPRVSTFAAGSDAEPHQSLAHDVHQVAPLGTPLAGVALELRDAGSDGVGELFVRSPFASLGTLRDGVLEPLAAQAGFATRDAARCTQDGQMELLGRRDGTIVRGGSNVYPENVERVADDVPGVHGSCLVPKASALYGQVPVLFVELDENGAADAVQRELMATLARELPPTDQPVEVRVLPSLPRTALGKVQRAALARLVTEGAESHGG
jgi:long-chain acyl-CoA synthetase